VMEHHHRSHLTQKNKAFKGGKHASKGSLKRKAGGRVNKEVRKGAKQLALDGKERRKQAAKHARALKRNEQAAKRRGIESGEAPPRTVGVISLHELMNTVQIAEAVVKEAEGKCLVEGRAVTVYSEKWKQRLSLFGCSRNVLDVLDLARVVDVLLLVIPADEGVDTLGQELVRLMKAQGCGTPLAVVAERPGTEVGPKKLAKMRKTMESALAYEFGTSVRVVDGTNQQELLRFLCQVGTKEPFLSRALPRGFVLAELPMKYEEDAASGESLLSITGYVRGAGITANQLVHVTGYGDFAIHSIIGHPDPCPVKKRRGAKEAMEEEKTEAVLETADPAKQPDLRPDVPLDPLEGEQNVFEEEEQPTGGLTTIRRVPHGMSAYQASWIVEEDLEEEDLCLDEAAADQLTGGATTEVQMEDAEPMDNDELEEGVSREEEQMVERGVVDMDLMDVAQLMEELQLEKKRRREEEEEDVFFPDEVDTPLDKPARERFRSYRQLKSFRTSPWDVKQNLPRDYARIIQFGNFQRTQKRVLADAEESVDVGTFVTLRIRNVPREVMAEAAWSVVMAVALFGYEQKTSVVNFTIQRYKGYNEPIANREELLFCYGFRRLLANPLFSEDSHNSSKHKLQRFLHLDTFSCATIFGPVTMPPCELLVFKQLKPSAAAPTAPAGLAFVGSGSLLSVDPDRLVIKRITLSGYPFKIIKKKAVIRFMFFNADDVKYYKPVELRTKYGRSGHIISSLGTHGYMKCRFDGQLMQHDTVLLHLYKRVFPKWTTTYWQAGLGARTDLVLPEAESV